MPVFNEVNTIAEIIKRVERVKLKDIDKEIIIVDDCSTDGTRELLNRYAKKYKVVYHKNNLGVGGAVKTGVKRATGEIVIIQHTDLEYDPNDYGIMLKPFLESNADAVLGSRFIDYKFNLFGKGKTPIPLHFFGNMILNIFFTIIYGRVITDVETAAKIFKSSVIKNIKIKSNRFDFEPEVVAKLLKKGYKVVEVPISYKPRTFEEGKKITWRDGIIALYTMIKYRVID